MSRVHHCPLTLGGSRIKAFSVDWGHLCENSAEVQERVARHDQQRVKEHKRVWMSIGRESLHHRFGLSWIWAALLPRTFFDMKQRTLEHPCLVYETLRQLLASVGVTKTPRTTPLTLRWKFWAYARDPRWHEGARCVKQDFTPKGLRKSPWLVFGVSFGHKWLNPTQG